MNYGKQTFSLFALGIASTMCMRFCVLYSNIFFDHAHIEPSSFAIFQASFLTSTIVGYLAVMVAGLLSKGHAPSSARILHALSLVGFAALFAGLGVAIASDLLESLFTRIPVTLALSVGFVSFAVSVIDLLWISRIATCGLRPLALTIGGGFGLGSVLAMLISRAPLGVAHLLILALCIVNLGLFYALAHKIRAATHASDNDAAPKRAASELAITKFPARKNERLEYAGFFVYLCTFSLITGISSRLFGSQVFGADLRQSTTLFAVFLAALLVIVIHSLAKRRIGSLAHFTASTTLVILALVTLPFMADLFDLLVSFIIFAAFFIALIAARALVADFSARAHVNFFVAAGLLFATCQTVQTVGYFVGSYTGASTYRESSLLVFMLCSIPLAAGAVVLNVWQQIRAKGLSSPAENDGAAGSAGASSHAAFPAASDASFAAPAFTPAAAPVPAPAPAPDLIGDFARAHQLTDREREVFALLIEGRTRTAIGNELFISPHTVKSHIQAIYRKCSCTGKQQLIDVWNAYKKETPL